MAPTEGFPTERIAPCEEWNTGQEWPSFCPCQAVIDWEQLGQSVTHRSQYNSQRLSSSPLSSRLSPSGRAKQLTLLTYSHVINGVCVCVCVYDRERERERDPDRKGLYIVNEHHKQSFILSMNENYIECFIFLVVRCDEHICASVPYSTLHDSYM